MSPIKRMFICPKFKLTRVPVNASARPPAALYNSSMLRVFFLMLAAATAHAADVNTFSIVAHDPVNGDWGVAVASRYFSVGSVVPWAEAGVGAIATQANVNVGYGPR